MDTWTRLLNDANIGVSALENWLISLRRDTSASTFEVIDVSEGVAPDSELVALIGEIVLDACLGADFFREAQKVLEWPHLGDLYRGAIPSNINMTRGIFGEVLSSYILEVHHGHVVPVKKARYRLGRNESPTGTDVIAILFDKAGSVASLCYVEAKLRTTNSDSRNLVSDAHEQLRNDRDTETPTMVQFVARVLADRSDPRSHAMLRYLRVELPQFGGHLATR